jgi:hypothetical protein
MPYPSICSTLHDVTSAPQRLMPGEGPREQRRPACGELLGEPGHRDPSTARPLPRPLDMPPFSPPQLSNHNFRNSSRPSPPATLLLPPPIPQLRAEPRPPQRHLVLIAPPNIVRLQRSPAPPKHDGKRTARPLSAGRGVVRLVDLLPALGLPPRLLEPAVQRRARNAQPSRCRGLGLSILQQRPRPRRAP